MLIYIGGGVAAAVLVAVLIVGTMSSGGGGSRKKENIRFGLTESKRKELFKELFHAVDEIGSSHGYKDCHDEWCRLGRELKLTDEQISEVFKEGMDAGWEQPAMAATMDQKHKTNRMEWIRTMNETHRNPIMSQ